MNYANDHIRNVMLAGHSGSGKTTLAEAMLYLTKGTDRFGRVEDGNTVCDFDPEEIKRHASLSLALAPVEYDGVKINLIDTPGLFDFEVGQQEAIGAAESVLIAVSARSGLTVGVQKAYKLAIKNGKSRMVYIGKVDAEHADFYKVFEDLKSSFGPSICPVVVPIEQAGGRVFLNLITMKAYSYAADGAAREVPVPSYGHRTEGLLEAMREAVAETDDALMEKFFEGEPFTQEELTEGVKNGVKTGAITPVFCGATTLLAGVDQVLWGIKKLLPSAARGAGAEATDRDGNPVEVECTPDAPVCAYVFKTVADPFVGKLSYVKVVAGELKADSPVVNSRTGEPERLGKLVALKGKKQTDISSIGAGDIGAITKMANTKTGDTLCAPSRVVAFPAPVFSKPTLSMAIKVKQKGDESKISGALQRLMEEDPSIGYSINTETVQQILSGLGEQHLDVVCAKLKSKFGVEVGLAEPRIAYRESIRKKCKAQGRHKKQTGGHGQFGDVWIEFEPTTEGDFIFEEKVFGGSVPKNFFPAVEKGLQEAVRHGVLAGYPVVGLKATLLDGSYHPVDSSEMAFKMAAKLAYKAALPEAGPILLEPIGSLKACVPGDVTGDIMGEVTKRRGRVLGMNPDEDNMQIVEAEVPVSEMHDFTNYLRQATQGRGSFTFDFVRYEPLPSMLEGKVIEDAKKFMDIKSDEE
ncbi:elongation factor G [uncultured Ruthenibacterium sp.]|uniref:elongation factor G n=1 Tax=uncultured Ruthenibacterium sp. TaxID=1905347 RepID=UPI00349E4BA3